MAHRPLRTGLAVVGVAVASALLLDMVLLAGGLERSFERLLLSRGFQIRVALRGTLPFDTEATLADVTQLVRSVRAQPEVAEAGAVLATSLYAPREEGAVALVGYGIDPSGHGMYEVIEGVDLSADDSTGVLLGRNAAVALGLSLGDTVRLAGRPDPQMAGFTGARPLTVRAVVRWLYDSSEMRSVGMLLPVVSAISTPDGSRDRASLVMVRVRVGQDVVRVAERLREAHPAVTVSTVEDMVAAFRERTTYFRQLSFVLGTISLVVTVLLIVTLLTITVNERLGEIAVLRAIGVGRGTVVRQILVEGTALTVAGAGSGILLGLGTARYLDSILMTFPGLPASISFFVAEPRGLAVAATVLFLAGTLAGVWPAWVAARAPIAATLKSDAW